MVLLPRNVNVERLTISQREIRTRHKWAVTVYCEYMHLAVRNMCATGESITQCSLTHHAVLSVYTDVIYMLSLNYAWWVSGRWLPAVFLVRVLAPKVAICMLVQTGHQSPPPVVFFKTVYYQNITQFRPVWQLKFYTSHFSTLTCFGPYRPSSEGTSTLFENYYSLYGPTLQTHTYIHIHILVHTTLVKHTFNKTQICYHYNSCP
jgi:hypothetical protein